MIAGRGIARIEALISGPAVLGLFAWFAIVACSEWAGIFSSPTAPPTPGPDAVYDGLAVHESPDGSVNFGSFHCDGQGKYLGGGDPDSERRFNAALKSQLESAKNEIKSIDQELQRCGGKKKFQHEYDAQAGCNRGKLLADRNRAEDLDKFIAGKERDLATDMYLINDAGRRLEGLQRSFETAKREGQPPANLETISKVIEFQTAELRAIRVKAAKKQKEVDDLRAERAALEQQPNHRNCGDADAAAKSDPCSEANFNRNDNRRSSLRTQAAVHQSNKDRFDKCIDDRKRQAKAQQERARPAVDPSFILNQPGLFRPSPRPSRPAPSQPSHPHKE
jgi:hypothetical protein